MDKWEPIKYIRETIEAPGDDPWAVVKFSGPLYFLYYNDSVRPNVSTFNGPILAKFAGLVEWLCMNDLKYVFRSPNRAVATLRHEEATASSLYDQ